MNIYLVVLRLDMNLGESGGIESIEGLDISEWRINDVDRHIFQLAISAGSQTVYSTTEQKYFQCVLSTIY